MTEWLIAVQSAGEHQLGTGDEIYRSMQYAADILGKIIPSDEEEEDNGAGRSLLQQLRSTWHNKVTVGYPAGPTVA